MNTILVYTWDAFKMSSENIIRDFFVKTKLPPLSPTDFSRNTQACVASTQGPDRSNYEYTNAIA